MSNSPAGAAPVETGNEPTLWITATRNNPDGSSAFMTYNVDPNGVMVSAPFQTPNTAISSIAVDPSDRSLWGANEGSSNPNNPNTGKLVNYDRTGSVIGEILARSFGAVGPEGLSITVSPGDDSLWVVDDPARGTQTPTFYNVTRDGDVISSFPTSTFDPESGSPQAIAFDAFTNTLWITDNSAETVYNISLDGTLISSFRTNSPPFQTPEFPTGVRNIQGISVESAEVLWITARDTARVYRVTRSGDAILSSFDIADVEPGASDPTGVAFDRPPGYVGAAAGLAVLALPGAKFMMKDVDEFTGVVGDVGLGGEQDFDEGLLTGTFLVDPSADNSNENSVIISGGTTPTDLHLASTDAEFAAVAASALTPTHVLGDIDETSTIVATSDANVVQADKIELDEEILTLVGDVSSSFVINVDNKFKLKNRSFIRLQGGLTSANVLINILGSDDSSIENGSAAVGTIIALDAKFKIKGDGATLTGSLIAGRELTLEDGGRVRVGSAELAPGDIGAGAGAAVLALPDSKVKLRDSGSVIVGDVALGPLAEQDFDKGAIRGSLVVDPAADNENDHEVTISNGTVISQQSSAVADAVDGSRAITRLQADQQFGDIKSDATIVGGPGLVVVRADEISLDNGEVLTLAGDASTRFVVTLMGRLQVKDGSSIVLAGGVLPENVLFNLEGSDDAIVESNSSVQGSILALTADKVKVKGSGSNVIGSLIGGGEISVEKSAAIAIP
ncbi:MAG: ice-binding family protein [Acidimicrobiales bacterium]